MKAYLLFHLNLSFSSIDKSSHKSIIEKCYYPILHLAEQEKIKISIEASATTLEMIQSVDNNFIKLLKKLIKSNFIELIGSSYVQSIFPINNAYLNALNLKWGLDYYKKNLSSSPKIALINEMCFSEGLVDLYLASGYKSIIIDIDNINADKKDKNSLYSFNRFQYIDQNINILWSDSILFQQFQRYIHGENILPEYINVIDQYIQNKVPYIPIYTNDAEVFNFRPGRFKEEKEIASDEWEKIRKLLVFLVQEKGLIFLFPSEIINNMQKLGSNTLNSISSIENPVLVKKQPKYNINRWTLTGRADQTLNLKINRAASLMQKKIIEDSEKNIKSLLCFSSSDLRTHITQNRWNEHCSQINQFEISNALINKEPKFTVKDSNDINLNDLVISSPYIDLEDKKFLHIKTKHLSLSLNLFKGMSIASLGFKKHAFKALIKTFPAGTFHEISHGVDFFSGSMLAEIPQQRLRITDLEKSEPFAITKNKDQITLVQDFIFDLFSFQKILTISLVEEKLSISYKFDRLKPFLGIIRVGNFTFDSKYFIDTYASTKLGSNHREKFKLVDEFDHSSPVSNLVSSSSGIPTTDGMISLYCKKNNLGLNFNFDAEKSFAIPMLKYKKIKPNNFFRLIYSLQEYDDTAKEINNINPVEIEISPS